VVSGAKYEERAKEKTRDAACNDALAFSQILIWHLPNTSHHLPHTSLEVVLQSDEKYVFLRRTILS